jgi:ABC-type nitrate/sulfonate/bicarbonate transport system substrate-binding protein
MRNTRTRLAALAAVAAMVAAALSGCGGASGGAEVTELRYQGSVGAVTLPELAADLGYLGNLKLKWIGNTISGPQDIQAATTGDTDFGGAFNGAIVKLAAAKAPIKAVIGYYGSDATTNMGFYVLNNSPIKTARDLIGKKIGVNTLGAHAEAIVKTYLTRNGLTDDEIKTVELVVVPPVNTEQSLRQGQSTWRPSARCCGTRPSFAAGSDRCSPTTACWGRSPPAVTSSATPSSRRTPTPYGPSSPASARPSSGRGPSRATW